MVWVVLVAEGKVVTEEVVIRALQIQEEEVVEDRIISLVKQVERVVLVLLLFLM